MDHCAHDPHYYVAPSIHHSAEPNVPSCLGSVLCYVGSAVMRKEDWVFTQKFTNLGLSTQS
jgi:hypothetical protein